MLPWHFPRPAASSALETEARPGVRLSTSFITTLAPLAIQPWTSFASGWSTGAPSRLVWRVQYCSGGIAWLSITSLSEVPDQACVMSSSRLTPRQDSTCANLPGSPRTCSGALS
ncbi:hypothetical protein J4558_15085 [Leptolyngbya sp. 15MV]|nr:hypothetical protein J4558_15085 [Leptolyngbya sp. 15MV]